MKSALRLLVLAAFLGTGAMACGPHYHGRYARYRAVPPPGHTYTKRLPSGQLLQCRVYQGSYSYRSRYERIYRLSWDRYARCRAVRERRYYPY
jgi:hypothetical protein